MNEQLKNLKELKGVFVYATKFNDPSLKIYCRLGISSLDEYIV